jgi:hypothetical protein
VSEESPEPAADYQGQSQTLFGLKGQISERQSSQLLGADAELCLKTAIGRPSGFRVR